MACESWDPPHAGSPLSTIKCRACQIVQHESAVVHNWRHKLPTVFSACCSSESTAKGALGTVPKNREAAAHPMVVCKCTQPPGGGNSHWAIGCACVNLYTYRSASVVLSDSLLVENSTIQSFTWAVCMPNSLSRAGAINFPRRWDLPMLRPK